MTTLFLCCAANAVAQIHIDPSGTGQVIYLPYYTVEDGQATLLAVSNNRNETKAIHLRFVEGRNGRSAVSLSLYLGPHDTWNGAVIAEGSAPDAGARLVSHDTSCVIPAIPATGLAFSNYDYTSARDDGQSSSLARTRTGAIEIIEMGVLSTFPGTAAANERRCTELKESVTVASVNGTLNTGVSVPTGGLSASLSVINVQAGLSYAVPGIAIANFAARPHHSEPTSEYPKLTEPLAAEVGAPLEVRFSDGTTHSFPANRGPDAISALFMTRALLGDYHLEESIDADTGWIVSFPTKHAYQVYAHLQDPQLFTHPTPFLYREGCTSLSMHSYTLDGISNGGLVFGGFNDPSNLALCNQTQLVDVRYECEYYSPVTHEAICIYTGESNSESGRVRLERNEAGVVLPNGEMLVGMPVVGVGVYTYRNTQAQPGMLANYVLSRALEREKFTVESAK